MACYPNEPPEEDWEEAFREADAEPTPLFAFRCMQCGEADEDDIPRALCSRCQWLEWQDDADD